MKLKAYLKLRGIGPKAAAKELDISRGWMMAILAGKPCGRTLAVRIEDWSEGAVSRDDLLYPDEAA